MEKYKIPKVPISATKSIRFPVDMIAQVEDAIRGKNCTFTAFCEAEDEYIAGTTVERKLREGTASLKEEA